MKTLPDLIDDIKHKLIVVYDIFLAMIETIGSKLNTWSWQKRWSNRQEGTGYRRYRKP